MPVLMLPLVLSLPHYEATLLVLHFHLPTFLALHSLLNWLMTVGSRHVVVPRCLSFPSRPFHAVVLSIFINYQKARSD